MSRYEVGDVVVYNGERMQITSCTRGVTGPHYDLHDLHLNRTAHYVPEDWLGAVVERRGHMEDEDKVIEEKLEAHRAGGEQLAQFFSYAHLPAAKQEVSRNFARLAVVVYETVPRNAERTASVRKILEAKDAAVRASFAK